MGETIRIINIHRKRLFREGLTFALSQQQDIAVVSSVSGVCEVLEEMARLRPDVIIIDLSLPEQDDLGEVRRIREASPEAKVLIMGLTDMESDILACIEAGASGYLPQEASLKDLLTNIRALAAGDALCSPKVAALLFTRVAESARERERLQALSLNHLTRREREIMALIEEGLSNKEIATALHIEIQTVKNHVHSILEKLQLDNRREAARYAREQRLLRRVH